MVEQLADAEGIILRREVIALGYDDNFLKRAVRCGSLIRMRQGAYALAPIWREAGRVERQLLLSRGVLKQYDDRVALSHASACVRYGGPSWGLDLDEVHLTNLFGRGERRAAGIAHHRGACRVDDVSRLDRGWITSPVRTALDTASLTSRDSAVCVLDWFANQGLATREQFEIGRTAKTCWPDTLDLLRKVRLVDSRSESVGETRSRLVCVDHRLPVPELQWEVFRPNGLLAGRTDFAWPAFGLLGEFDGRTKYLKYRRPGESMDDAVLREKRREDLLRELTGWKVIRFDWADLARPATMAARIRRSLGLVAA